MAKPMTAIELAAICPDMKIGRDGSVSGTMRPGFLDWAAEHGADRRLVLYPPRLIGAERVDGLNDWLWTKIEKHLELLEEKGSTVLTLFRFRVANERPKGAETYITARAMQNKKWTDM